MITGVMTEVLFLCPNLAPFYDFSVMFSLFFHTIY